MVECFAAKSPAASLPITATSDAVHEYGRQTPKCTIFVYEGPEKRGIYSLVVFKRIGGDGYEMIRNREAKSKLKRSEM